MNRIGVDLIGEVHLIKNSEKLNSILKDYWGHANMQGEKRSDSYYLYLIKENRLGFGEKCKAEFKFKFSEDERFTIKLQVGQILELYEGSRKIGEFLIEEITNEKLKL